MECKPYLDDSLVLLDVEAQDKWALIDLMVDAIMRNPMFSEKGGEYRTQLREAVVARETERPTGLEAGFAFPHARILDCPASVLCVALPKTPVDFGAIDGQPASFVCLMVVPEDQAQCVLRLMSQFARLFLDEVDRAVLLSLKDAPVVAGFLQRRILGKDTPIAARDIMRPPRAKAHPDTPLKEVTRIMHQHMLDAIGITEEDDTLTGEITCDLLFKRGMPDFFSQLKSISFISEFDPFERYFAGESRALARDVMSKDFAAVTEDATLLEIVFELAVRRRPKVYVVRDGKRVGVIDRIQVLDRVLNI